MYPTKLRHFLKYKQENIYYKLYCTLTEIKTNSLCYIKIRRQLTFAENTSQLSAFVNFRHISLSSLLDDDTKCLLAIKPVDSDFKITLSSFDVHSRIIICFTNREIEALKRTIPKTNSCLYCTLQFYGKFFCVNQMN